MQFSLDYYTQHRDTAPGTCVESELQHISASQQLKECLLGLRDVGEKSGQICNS